MPHISTTDKNILTFTLSALFVSSLVMGIVFTLDNPKPTNSLPSLDIILSKHKSLSAPKKADYLAKNNQQGGGESEKSVHPQNIKTGIAVDDQGNHLQEQIENIPNIKKIKNLEIVTTNNSSVMTLSSKTAHESINNKNTVKELTRNQRLAKLENNISNRIEKYAKRPKSKFLSASTKSYEFANYMQTWVKKIERTSNLNYPEEARKKNFVGALVMSVGIDIDGYVKETIILKSSGFKAIDDAAIHLVYIAEPFESIPENTENIDTLYITRTWQFLPGNKLKQK